MLIDNYVVELTSENNEFTASIYDQEANIEISASGKCYIDALAQLEISLGLLLGDS